MGNLESIGAKRMGNLMRIHLQLIDDIAVLTAQKYCELREKYSGKQRNAHAVHLIIIADQHWPQPTYKNRKQRPRSKLYFLLEIVKSTEIGLRSKLYFLQEIRRDFNPNNKKRHSFAHSQQILHETTTTRSSHTPMRRHPASPSPRPLSPHSYRKP